MAQPINPRIRRGCGLGCLGLIILVIISALIGGKQEPTGLSVGKSGVVEVPGEATVLLAVDEAALDAFTKASVAKDLIGVGALVGTGQLFEVPAGTKCLVIDQGFARRQVRITEGDRFGASGWVPYEWVKAE